MKNISNKMQRNLKSGKLFLPVIVLGCVLLAVQPTQASEIQVVGNLDGSVNVSKVYGEDTKVQFASGFRHGSSLGIIGTEDLGGGNEVGFFLDQGFSLMNGQVVDGPEDSAFSREAMLYYKGGIGKLGLGRFGTLSSGTGSFTMLSGWVFGTTYTTAAWSEFGRVIPQYRLNNAVAYVTPDLSGFTFSLMYSNGTPNDNNRWSRNSHYYGVAARYEQANLLTSLVLESADHKDPGTIGNRGRRYEVNYGMEAKFSAFTAMFAYQFHSQEQGIKDNIFGVSARIPALGGDVLVGTRYLFGKNDSANLGDRENKRRAWSLNAAYEYPLSKRSTLWAYGGVASGKKGLSTDFIEGRRVNYNGWQTVFGMTHKF